MLTQLVFNDDARQKMKTGVDKLANAVKVTLGAKGRNVAIRDERTGQPSLTKDGVTVARWINLQDKQEDAGAQLIKGAAIKTAILAGDGTTTSTLLAQVIISEGMKALDGKANPIDIKKGIDRAVVAVTDYLKTIMQPITPERKISVATISANNDSEIGALVAEVLTSVGDDGLVTIQESKTSSTYTEKIQGLQLERGYISHYFVNNMAKMLVEYDNPLILLCERKVTTHFEIEKILNYALAKKQPLLIIAEDVDAEALAVLIANRMQRGHLFSAIKLPGFGNMQQQILEDIAVITGAKVVSAMQGVNLSDIIPSEYLGGATKLTISNMVTNIIGGKGKASKIEEQIEQVKALITNNVNEYEVDKLKKQRLSKLVNGVAVIHVGATTEIEMREKKDRIDDSLCATRAAVTEGILPGGGIAYLRAIPVVNDLTSTNVDEQKGIDIIKKALEAPFTQIMLNAGLEAEGMLTAVMAGKDDYGFNVKSEEFENFFETGIIDPVKVTRVALENAASVSSMFLTTECLITDVAPEK